MSTEVLSFLLPLSTGRSWRWRWDALTRQRSRRADVLAGVEGAWSWPVAGGSLGDVEPPLHHASVDEALAHRARQGVGRVRLWLSGRLVHTAVLAATPRDGLPAVRQPLIDLFGAGAAVWPLAVAANGSGSVVVGWHRISGDGSDDRALQPATQLERWQQIAAQHRLRLDSVGPWWAGWVGRAGTADGVSHSLWLERSDGALHATLRVQRAGEVLAVHQRRGHEARALWQRLRAELGIEAGVPDRLGGVDIGSFAGATGPSGQAPQFDIDPLRLEATAP